MPQFDMMPTEYGEGGEHSGEGYQFIAQRRGIPLVEQTNIRKEDFRKLGLTPRDLQKKTGAALVFDQRLHDGRVILINAQRDILKELGL